MNGRFIASQGPLEHTCPHFWQMVAENEVNLIVMLTKLKERAQQQNHGIINACASFQPISSYFNASNRRH